MSATTTADGTWISFDVDGVGEPLLLLAGQANSRRWWNPVRPDLAVGHMTIALDDASAELRRITATTLMLHGTDDMFRPAANADLLTAGIPGARLMLFEGARHAYFLEQRREASDRVLGFLAERPV